MEITAKTVIKRAPVTIKKERAKQIELFRIGKTNDFSGDLSNQINMQSKSKWEEVKQL